MHYLEEGWREGRDPSPTFSTNDYLAARRDVARAGINPLLHHVRYGPTPDTSGRSRRTVRRLRSMAGRARALTPLPEDTLERGPLRKERDLTEAFVRRYAKATGGPLADGAPELPSEAVPVDRRGVLVQPGDQPDGAPSVDVVVCVHDALADLRRCVLSLLAKTRRPFHLILVNDGSGPETSEFLRRFAEQNPAVEVVAREPPHGYTLAANAGVRAATGDYVVLLNSDTIVTFGWLDRIIECGESDPAIGIVGPLSNAASYQSVPKLKEAGAWAVNELPDFLTPDGLASLLVAASPRAPTRAFPSSTASVTRSSGRSSIRSACSTRSTSRAATARRTTSACAPRRRGSSSRSPTTPTCSTRSRARTGRRAGARSPSATTRSFCASTART